MSYPRTFTSESVSEGHPDKIADQISDAILDAILEQDPHARVACETLVNTGLIFIGGEISTTASVNYEKVARQVVKDIGYNSSEMGFDWESCSVITAIGEQSADIARGVNINNDQKYGAGDQGIMFGYACNETDVLMPAPIIYAHRLMQRQAKLRKQGTLPWLRPDAKSQVTLCYDNAGQPVGVDAVVLSTQHSPDIKQDNLIEAVIEEIILPVFPKDWLHDTTRFYVNPTGRFVVGGPLGDCGMTGRKIIVDTYGGRSHHGGGAFSGKDPTKVDRAGAYVARYIAKNIVAAGLADRCELELSFAIGIPEPLSIGIDTFDTGQIPEPQIVDLILENFDLSPGGIIKTLKLQQAIYRPTACYGHFGREEPSFHWEKTDVSKTFSR